MRSIEPGISRFRVRFAPRNDGCLNYIPQAPVAEHVNRALLDQEIGVVPSPVPIAPLSTKLAEGRNYGFDRKKQGAAVFWILDELGASHVEALCRFVLRLHQHSPNADAL